MVRPAAQIENTKFAGSSGIFTGHLNINTDRVGFVWIMLHLARSTFDVFEFTDDHYRRGHKIKKWLSKKLLI
ncbi:hypothetical protein Ancab_033630 [Ancistrocladus abbreviatus]